MILGLFKKTDPVCGMKEEKDKGIEKNGKWFCSAKCVKEFEKKEKKEDEEKCCCCG
jgi:YHS domain-containing protein